MSEDLLRSFGKFANILRERVIKKSHHYYSNVFPFLSRNFMMVGVLIMQSLTQHIMKLLKHRTLHAYTIEEKFSNYCKH